MFTRAYLCLTMFTSFTYVYHFLLVLSNVYSLFTRVYLRLHHFTRVYRFFRLYVRLLMFIYVYLCLPMFTPC